MLKINKPLKILYKIGKRLLSGSSLERNYLVRRFGNHLKAHLRSEFVYIDGHKLFLDSLDSLRLSINGIFEAEETNLVKKIIKSGDVVVDIGANIGYYTLIFAKIIGEHGKVYAFEPEPTNYNILKKNVDINNYTNVELIKKAVSSKTEKTRLFPVHENKGGYSLVNRNDSTNFIEIESIKLDDYFAFYNGEINFLKMDIEGFEIEATKGMLSLLTKQQNIKLMIEVHPHTIKKFNVELEKYLELLEKMGFELKILEKNMNLVPLNRQSVKEICKPEKGNTHRIFCFKKH